MSRVEVRGVQKRFGSHLAVDVASVDLADGELAVLLGPSGCGKTTLLRILAGFERPDAGCVTVGDQLLTGPGRNLPPEQRGIGMVFQDHALFPHLRVADNIAFGLPRGRKARQARVAELAELVGLPGMERRYPHELSGGQRQRVALARAMAPQPGVLLLDEPFSGLDATTRVRVREEVRGILAAAGITALLVTHDQEEALSLAQQLLVMHDGRVAQAGLPAELYAAPVDAWVAGFLGDIDLLPGTVTKGRADCELGAFAATDHADGPVRVGFRPEALELRPADDPQGIGVVLRATEFFGHDMLVHVSTAAGTALRVRATASSSAAISGLAAAAPGTAFSVAVLDQPTVFAASDAEAAARDGR